MEGDFPSSAFEVTMHVYSGRPDPTWKLEPNHVHYREIKARLGEIPSNSFPARLGYRGFSIKRIANNQKRSDVTSVPTLHLSGHVELESLFLKTASGISESLRQHATNAITQRGKGMAEGIMRLRDKSCTLPKFEPAKWNDAIHQTFNGCYNYAVDLITDTFARPGRATGHTFPDPPRGIDIKVAAQSDGNKIITVSDPDVLPPYEWNLIALVFWPTVDPVDTWDYHFYRLDEPGRFWSHKPGRTPVIDVDNGGHKIEDPRYCARGPYTEFVTFMQTRTDKVVVA